MRYLRKRYRIVSIDQMLREMAEGRSSDPAVAITFDDGYADLYTHAFPILRSYDIPATIFLTVGAIESGNVAWYDRVFVAFQVAPAGEYVLPLSPPRHLRMGTPEERLGSAEDFISLMRKLPASEQRACCAMLENAVEFPAKSLEKRMLSWDQVRDMQKGGISFGAHTMTHPVVSRLPESDLDWELRESKRIVEERLQSEVKHFAFPFGKSDECGDAAVARLKQLGYRSASTTTEGINDSWTDPFQLRRVSFCEERLLASFALKLSHLFLFRDSAVKFAGALKVGDDNGYHLPHDRSGSGPGASHA
jgi:hypothetical protein